MKCIGTELECTYMEGREETNDHQVEQQARVYALPQPCQQHIQSERISALTRLDNVYISQLLQQKNEVEQFLRDVTKHTIHDINDYLYQPIGRKKKHGQITLLSPVHRFPS